MSQGMFFDSSQGLFPEISQRVFPGTLQELFTEISQEVFPATAQGMFPEISQEVFPEISQGVFPKISQGVFPETSQGSGTLPGSLKTLSGGSGNLRKQLQTCLEQEMFGNPLCRGIAQCIILGRYDEECGCSMYCGKS